jgi:hypothetical protein
LSVSNLRKEEREVMSLVERAIADYEADLADAHQSGVDENRLETAKRMLAKKYPFSEIQDMTELDLEEIEELQEQME